MAKLSVGINGFGRIGRAFFRLAQASPDVEVVAINDLGVVEGLAYLLERDTVYGKADFSVSSKPGFLIAAGREINVFAEKEPASIPWGTVGAKVVVESTGVFDSFEKAKAHLTGGALHVVISAPAKDADTNQEGATVLVGINEEKLKTCSVTANASCTTNAGSPLMAILDEKLGIEHALLSTTHAMTASQSLVDGHSKGNMREWRAAGHNLVPTSTGAAIAVTKALPQLEKKFDGISIRAPVLAGSIVDVTLVTKKPTTVEEVNAILSAAALDERWKGIFAVTKEQLVSSDIVGRLEGSIADLSLTRVVGGTLVKVMAWYDNEMGYASTLLKHVIQAGK
ncbi:MAG: glyceraldehyde 3-phosphate dehydrogenase NAD-binding domain-containing protein [Patescibacteria group bacterium]